MARVLNLELKEKNIDTTYSFCLKIVAKMHGFPSYAAFVNKDVIKKLPVHDSKFKPAVTLTSHELGY